MCSSVYTHYALLSKSNQFMYINNLIQLDFHKLISKDLQFILNHNY